MQPDISDYQRPGYGFDCELNKYVFAYTTFENDTSYVPDPKSFGRYLERILIGDHPWIKHLEKELSLDDHEIGYTHIELVAKAIRDPRCKWEHISISHVITDEYLEYLCDALYDNNTINELDFKYSKISDAGCRHIADLCEVNKTIRSIWLFDNDDIITDAGIELLKNCCDTVHY